MQSEKSTVPFFRLDRWITIAGIVLVFSASSVFAQDLRQRQLECEKLFSAAVAAERRNDPIEAELRYEDCRDLAKKYRFPQLEAAALHRIAVIRAKNNKFSESANLFRRAIELDPRNALILCDFAQLYAERKNFVEAETILKNAMNIDPNNPKVLYNLGIVIALQRGDRHTEGLRYLKLAIGEADAYRELARIYRAKGELSQAEFADQKAELAENQRTANRGLVAGVSNGDSTAVSPPQRETPPEVVNRVREELAELEMREMVAAKQQASLPPIVQKPFIPTTTTETVFAPQNEPFPVIANVPPSQVIVSQSSATVPKDQPPANLPVVPFAPTATQQQGSSASPVRRLETPTGNTVPAQSPVRMLPRFSETPPNQNNVPVSPVPNRVSESKPMSDQPASDMDTSAPQLVKVLPTTQPETGLPLRTVVSADTTRLISLPPTQVVSGSVERIEQTATANPLRRIPAEQVGLIDPGADTSQIAALPAYSDVGIRRIPRTDEPLPVIESQPGRIVAFGTAETAAETARAPKPLPVRDVDVLQSPSTVIARRETPWSVSDSPSVPVVENSFHVAEVRSESSFVQEKPEATPELETTRITQSTSRFSTATTPSVFAFATVREEPTPVLHTIEPVEVAVVKPLVPDTTSPTTSLVRLPEIADEPVVPKVVAINATPIAPSATNNLARMANEGTVPTPVPVQAAPANPLLAANNLSRIAETRTAPTPVPMVAGPIPVREESTGFATSRRPNQSQEVRVSGNDNSPGFARSRR